MSPNPMIGANPRYFYFCVHHNRAKRIVALIKCKLLLITWVSIMQD